MKKTVILALPPLIERDDEEVRKLLASELKLEKEAITAVRKLRRSLDARPRDPVFRVQYEVYINEHPAPATGGIEYKNVEKSPEAHIIGFGPAGMFAALRLLELGIKPVIFERGKNVRERRFDLRAIQLEDTVHPDSNYCFGEGGAGTFSDGKLYTRSTKKGDIKKILQVLVNHGAREDILIDAHPHIGSNKLPSVVQAMRETILSHGGEIHFGSKVTSFVVTGNELRGLVINGDREVPVSAALLATGHSARDVFRELHRQNIFIEAKPFALGVRIEHPQELINRIQYSGSSAIPTLPSASYSAVCQSGERGVFSFCMCPGGIIIPAATSPGEIVLNGMSVSKRNSPFANSGLVVTVGENDFQPYASMGALAGMEYQAAIEQAAFTAGGCSQTAPAQRATDFLNDKASGSLPKSSYIPGLFPFNLAELFPSHITKGIKTALVEFNKKMKGYLTEEAVLAAPESRTSSPVRITRDKETAMHTQVRGLFPSGEGAGYAGGIVSAAIDGELSANALAKYLRAV